MVVTGTEYVDYAALREREERRRELLTMIWTVLRGVVAGVLIDTDQAKYLSERLDEEFKLT